MSSNAGLKVIIVRFALRSLLALQHSIICRPDKNNPRSSSHLSAGFLVSEIPVAFT